MFILIDGPAGSPTIALKDPTDFRSFKVVIANAATESSNQALAQLGDPAPPDHVFVERRVIETLAGPGHRQDPKWQAGLTAMADYARRAGWTDDSGRIRAHIERPS